MSKITLIKKYLDEVFPRSNGIYTSSVNRKDMIFFNEDDRLEINFLYESNDQLPKTIKKDLIKNLDKIVGIPCIANRIVPYTDGTSIRVIMYYKYSLNDELPTQVSSKGFRTLLGFK